MCAAYQATLDSKETDSVPPKQQHQSDDKDNNTSDDKNIVGQQASTSGHDEPSTFPPPASDPTQEDVSFVPTDVGDDVPVRGLQSDTTLLQRVILGPHVSHGQQGSLLIWWQILLDVHNERCLATKRGRKGCQIGRPFSNHFSNYYGFRTILLLNHGSSIGKLFHHKVGFFASVFHDMYLWWLASSCFLDVANQRFEVSVTSFGMHWGKDNGLRHFSSFDLEQHAVYYYSSRSNNRKPTSKNVPILRSTATHFETTRVGRHLQDAFMILVVVRALTRKNNVSFITRNKIATAREYLQYCRLAVFGNDAIKVAAVGKHIVV